MTIEDRYLGDGVYASWDGYHIVLDLRAESSHRICLDNQVLIALDCYREAVKDALFMAEKENEDEGQQGG